LLTFPWACTNPARSTTPPLLTPVFGPDQLLRDIQWTNEGTYGLIVSKHSGSTNAHTCLTFTSTITQFEFMVIKRLRHARKPGLDLSPGDVSNGYHQLVGTYDGLTMRLYYDGVLEERLPIQRDSGGKALRS